MARVLDTRQLAPANVADVVHDLFAHNTVPLEVAVDTTAPLIVNAARLDHASLLSTQSHGLWLRRAERHTEEGIAFAIQQKGVAWFEYNDRPSRYVTPGMLFITDQSSPYRYHARGPNASCSIEMGYDELGLPVDVARKAAARLGASPLYGLVTNHLLALHGDLDQIEADPVAASSAIAATTDLLRALVASAAEVQRYVSPAMADALLPMILAYTRQHLRDPDLTPLRIARHHNISLRYLYKLCASADIRLMDWIVQQRLEGARKDIARHRHTPTIAQIAHRWGFKDARHFSARFRGSYGCSPREWRAHATNPV